MTQRCFRCVLEKHREALPRLRASQEDIGRVENGNRFSFSDSKVERDKTLDLAHFLLSRELRVGFKNFCIE